MSFSQKFLVQFSQNFLGRCQIVCVKLSEGIVINYGENNCQINNFKSKLFEIKKIIYGRDLHVLSLHTKISSLNSVHFWQPDGSIECAMSWCNTFLSHIVRDTGTGGQWGQLSPITINIEAVGMSATPPPQLWTDIVIHFYFCLFLHVNLGLFQKSGSNPGSF